MNNLCSDVAGAPSCCETCHADNKLGYSLYQYKDVKDIHYSVCCKVYKYLDKTKCSNDLCINCGSPVTLEQKKSLYFG